MSGLPPRSENHATKIVPSFASSTLGSSSFVGLPADSKAGSLGAHGAGGVGGECESLHARARVIRAAAARVLSLIVLVPAPSVLAQESMRHNLSPSRDSGKYRIVEVIRPARRCYSIFGHVPRRNNHA